MNASEREQLKDRAREWLSKQPCRECGEMKSHLNHQAIFGAHGFQLSGEPEELIAAFTEGEIKELQEWKDSAIKLLPLQEWAQELGVPLGQPIHDKILPALKELSRLRQK